MSFWHFLLGCHFTRYLEENVFSNYKINLVGQKKETHSSEMQNAVLEVGD